MPLIVLGQSPTARASSARGFTFVLEPAAQELVFALRVAAGVRAACSVRVTTECFACLWWLLRRAAATALALAVIELFITSTVERDAACRLPIANFILCSRNARRRHLGGEVVVAWRLVLAVTLLDGFFLATLNLVVDDDDRKRVVCSVIVAE